MFEKIVIGFDNTESGRAALKESSLLAQGRKDALILVHATPLNREEFSHSPELQENRLKTAEKLCSEAVESVRGDYPHPVEVVLSEADPHDIIIDVAKERNADLIVMGTCGGDALTRMILGSVTTRVILDSPCSVLVVKKSCDLCTGRYRKILVPYDGSESGRKALHNACELANRNEGKVVLFYVIPRHEEMVEFFKTDHMKRSMWKEAEKLLDRAVNEVVPKGTSVETVIHEGHTAEEIVSAASEMSPDLIVMGSHGWKGFSRAIMGSTTRRVITNTSTPVLVTR